MTDCDVITIRNTIITSEGTILLHLLESGIREIKRSPDTMKAAAILVAHGPGHNRLFSKFLLAAASGHLKQVKFLSYSNGKLGD